VIAIDDIALANNDRVLIKAQSDKSKNGIYVWSSATQKLTRATDADSSAELAGLLTQVLSGSDAGRAFRQSALGSSDTVGGAPIQWSAQNGTPRFKMKVWILPDSNTTRNQINAMKDTTRPMNILYANFPPHLRDTPVIPYPFRNTRLGFTIGQRTSATDQTVSITNPYTTWLD
jgi:hypothetical protein